jgi:multicomponent Na+:H+ antiporter subunit G
MIDFLAYSLIIIGITADLFGCIGLVRLPDLYNRLQASAKCVTLGTCGILFGALLKFGLTAMGMKALVCAVFLLLTSPVAAHALARAAHRAGLKPCSKTNCDAYDEDKDLIS